MTAAIPASRSTLETAALYCDPIVPLVPTFANHHHPLAATDEPVSVDQQDAMPLPIPASLGGGTYDSGLLQWRYPFHRMFVGQAIFIADRAGLAEAAMRAVRTYRKQMLQRDIWKPEFQWRQTTIENVRGVVIGRIA